MAFELGLREPLVGRGFMRKVRMRCGVISNDPFRSGAQSGESKDNRHFTSAGSDLSPIGLRRIRRPGRSEPLAPSRWVISSEHHWRRGFIVIALVIRPMDCARRGRRGIFNGRARCPQTQSPADIGYSDSPARRLAVDLCRAHADRARAGALERATHVGDVNDARKIERN